MSAEIDEPSNDEMDVSDSDNDEGTAYKKRKMEISETNSLKVLSYCSNHLIEIKNDIFKKT